MTMRGQTVSRMLVILLAVCCLVPLAALAAVLDSRAPVWPAPAGLLAIVLLARRLMALLAEVDDGAGSSRDYPVVRGRSTRYHDRH